MTTPYFLATCTGHGNLPKLFFPLLQPRLSPSSFGGRWPEIHSGRLCVASAAFRSEEMALHTA